MLQKKGFEYWLYHARFTPDQYLDYLNTLLHNTKKPINFQLITCDSSLFKELSDWNPKYFDVKVSGNNKIFTLNVNKVMENEFKKLEQVRTVNVKARIIKYESLPVYIIFSDCNKSDFKNVLTKLMMKHYPKVSKLFLTNREIEKIVMGLEESTQNEIVVENYSTKERLFGRKKKIKTTLSYTEEYQSDFFADVAHTNSWINSIRFVAKVVKDVDNKRISFSKFTGVIARECFFSCVSNFQPFIDVVIPSALEYAYKRNEYLKKREKILKKRTKQLEPIVIKFKDEPFADVNENKNFVEALLALEKFSVSSFHINPYIQVSLLDYLDGSSYNLWVVSKDRLVIYPQISASTASMHRVVNHIFERISEGMVEDYSKIPI